MTSTDFSSLPPEPPLARFALPFFALTLGGLFLAARHPMSPGVLTALTAILGLGYLPGLALTLVVERRFGLWAGWVLPLMLSPVLVSLACVLLVYAGVSLTASYSWIVMGAVGVICLTPPPQRELEDRALTLDTPEFLHRRSDRGQVLFLAGFILALLAAMFLAPPHAMRSSEFVIQVAVAESAAFEAPPSDPLLAGLPFRGAWAWPLFVGGIAQAANLEVSTILVISSLVAAFTMVFAAYRALGALGLDHGRALWGTVFLFFALTPSVWGWFAEAPQPFFLGTLLVPGGHWMGWMYSVLGLWGVLTFLRDSKRSALWAFLAFSGLWLFFPPAGAFWSLLFVIVMPVTWVLCKLLPWRGTGLRVLVTGLLGPLAAAALLPYLNASSPLGMFPIEDYLEFNPSRYGAVFTMLHWEGAVGVAAYFVFLASPRLRYQMWAIWGVAAVFLSVVRFGPPGVEYLNHLLMAPLIGSLFPLDWGKASPLKPVVIVLVGVMLLGGTVMGMMRLPSREHSPANRALVEWIQENTEPESVFVTLDPWSALRAKRAVFYNRDHVTRRGHQAEAVTQRGHVHFGILNGGDVQLVEDQVVSALDRPVYWIDADDVEARSPWVLVTSLENARVYRWNPTPP